MMRLINYLEKEFTSRNESCTLIIEPAIPNTIQSRTFLTKPDALILKDNVFCLIEMKGFSGDIIADCSPRAVWKSKEGKVLQSIGSPNPFSQAGRHRRALIEYLQDHFSFNECAPIRAKKDPKRMYDWLVEHIQSWVVTEEASRPILKGINPREFPSFRVLSLDRLPQALMFIRSDPLLNTQGYEKFINLLEVKKVNKNEWYRSESSGDTVQPLGLIPKISSWLDTGDKQIQLKALKYIRELELKQHRPHIVRCWSKSQFPDIRLESLLILIEWQDEKLGSFLNNGLQDRAIAIVDFSLKYLMTNGYPETVITLEKMLKSGPPEIYPGVLKAITSSGHPDSGSLVYDFAKNTLLNKPFQKFQHFRNMIKSIRLKESTKETHKELNRLISERRKVLNLTQEVINSLGDLHCKESIPWLIEILIKPTSLGFESNDYTELDNTSNYYSVFEATCKSLGKLGEIPDHVTTFLINRCASSPEDFQWCIIGLLGDLGETAALPTLLQYLKNRESRLFDVTVNALSKISSEDSFDALAETYLSNPFDYSSITIGVVLEKINRDWYINILLDQLDSEKIKNEAKRDYLQALLPVVTLRCAETLFPLLKNNKLSSLAAWNLSNLVEHKYVFTRAMKLTWSRNPIEKASAIWVLEKHFIENSNELERFETEKAHKEVRRAVAALYLSSKSKLKLYKYANDPDKEVRDHVFESFYEGTMFGEHFIVSDIRKLSRCNVAIDEESLGIRLIKEVLIISKKDIAEVSVTSDGKDTYGIYLVIQDGGNFAEQILLVPSRIFLGSGKYKVDNMRENLAIGSRPGYKEMDNILDELWSKVTSSIQTKEKKP